MQIDRQIIKIIGDFRQITVSWNCQDVRIDLKNRFDDLLGRFSPTKVRDIAREEYQIHLADLVQERG